VAMKSHTEASPLCTQSEIREIKTEEFSSHNANKQKFEITLLDLRILGKKIRDNPKKDQIAGTGGRRIPEVVGHMFLEKGVQELQRCS